jgi:hypothetical protein
MWSGLKGLRWVLSYTQGDMCQTPVPTTSERLQESGWLKEWRDQDHCRKALDMSEQVIWSHAQACDPWSF